MQAQYPHLQPFNLAQAKSAMHERMQTNVIGHVNLKRRLKDFTSLSAKAIGFHKPGSNKK